ncbi:MAG: hypothetical protein ACOYOS_00170 [Syntrophales bacterium]
MALLAGVNYDPTTAVQKSCTSLLAMTAFDTTNLRLTFTAPSNGAVLVRMRCSVDGATTAPTILLGILAGSTVIARQSPIGAYSGPSGTGSATTQIVQEALFTITGLTGGNSYTWDAAYGVEILLSGCTVNYGGPNNATGDNAFGGFQFEIWEAPTLLGSIDYDPSTAATKSTATLIAMTAMDTTNLRLTFTAPSSGKVLVRMRGVTHGATSQPQILFGVMSGAAVVGRVCPMGGYKTTAVATAQFAREGQFLVTGLTPGNSYTYDAAYGVEVVVSSTGLKYGGPNNTTTNDAFGMFLFEIWEA